MTEIWREIEALRRQIEELRTRERTYLRAGTGDRVTLPEQATPATPASGFGTIFVGNASPNNGVPSGVDDAGTVYQMVRYATGTWTPSLVGSGTAGTFTYGAGNGAEYTRIGNRVLINGRLQITATAVAPVGNLAIAGLPIAGAASASVIAGGAEIFNWGGFNVAAGYTDIGGQVITGASVIGIVKNGDNLVPAYVLGSEAATTLDLQFFGHYRIA